ncbi:MAG TPA: protein-disulfide reductase DsbD domain-containing protein [Marivita sp.]|nr:protein-disulfide reductase DsbD domain-containing protein [Marivita sp.]
MSILRSLLSASVAALALFGAPMGHADSVQGLSKVELRPGWRMTDGTHMAALHLVLEPGWKTYWRAPGDVGIPPQFDWSGSENIAAISTNWPTPEVFFEQGMRSVGYRQEVVIPLHMALEDSASDIQLTGKVQIGICKDICIPANLSFEAMLPPALRKTDPTIAAALVDRPFSAKEAGVRDVTCSIKPGVDGELILHTSITMPATGGTEYVVVEARNPHVWVAEPNSHRDGDTLHASTRLMHVDGNSFALNRSELRFTVLGGRHAVDIQGCSQ